MLGSIKQANKLSKRLVRPATTAAARIRIVFHDTDTGIGIDTKRG